MIDENVLENDGGSGAIASPPLASQLGGQALYVLAGNIFTLVVGLPLQIYVSRKLGSVGLGTYSLIEGMTATAAGLLGLGLAPTAVRFIPQYLEEGNSSAIVKLVTRGALALLALGLVGYASFFLVALWGHFAFSSDRVVLALMGATIPLSLLAYFAQQSLRGFREIRYLIMGSSFVQVSAKAVATVVFFALGARLAGYAAATVLASSCVLAWLAFGLVRRVRSVSGRSQQPQSAGDWKRFAAISFATSLMSLPSLYLDRFLLGFFVGASPVGVLAVTRQLQQLPTVLYQMLLSVAAPMFAGAHTRNARSEQEHLYALTTDWAMKAALPLILFLGLFARPVLSLFGERFAEAGKIPLLIFLIAQLFNLGSGPNGNIALMSGLERDVFRVDLVAMAVAAVLTLVFVPILGLLGAALCGLINSIAINAWMMLLVRRRLGIRWWNRRYVGWLTPVSLTAVIGWMFVAVVPVWSPVLLALVLVVMYASFACVSLLQGLHQDDRDLIAHVKSRFFME